MKNFGYYQKGEIKNISPVRNNTFDELIRSIKQGKINKIEDIPKIMKHKSYKKKLQTELINIKDIKNKDFHENEYFKEVFEAMK